MNAQYGLYALLKVQHDLAILRHFRVEISPGAIGFPARRTVLKHEEKLVPSRDRLQAPSLAIEPESDISWQLPGPDASACIGDQQLLRLRIRRECGLNAIAGIERKPERPTEGFQKRALPVANGQPAVPVERCRDDFEVAELNPVPGIRRHARPQHRPTGHRFDIQFHRDSSGRLERDLIATALESTDSFRRGGCSLMLLDASLPISVLPSATVGPSPIADRDHNVCATQRFRPGNGRQR